MATQLKDFRPNAFPSGDASRSSAKPTIRIAFSAGPATLAVREKVAPLPEAEQSLEQVAAQPHPTLRALLADYKAASTILNAADAPTDEQTVGALLTMFHDTETRLLSQPAATSDDVIAKLVALAQIAAGGLEVDDDEAAAVLQDVKRFFGMGYVHHRFPTPTAAPVEPNDGWQLLYRAYLRLREDRIAYEHGTLNPAVDRFHAVRGAWPENHNIAGDPIATAALAPLNYDVIQDQFEEMVVQESAGLSALVRTPAPNIDALTTKLALFQEQELHADKNAAELVAALLNDARRFSDRTTSSDERAILAAFDGYRDDLRRLGEEETENLTGVYASMDIDETILLETPATTIASVVAKLRYGFKGIGEGRWVDGAVIDPQAPAFVSALGMEDCHVRTLWSAIEDLARIGRIDLTRRCL